MNKKINILYLIDVFKELAGAERNLFEVVTRINKERFIPIVVCLEGGNAVNVLRDNGVEVVDLQLKRIYSLFAVPKIFRLFRLLRERNINILVSYHESSDFLNAIIGKLAQVPVLISSRRDMGYKLKKHHIFFYKLINPLFDKIITVSDAVKEIIFERENTLWCKMITVHNGVDLEKFSKPVDVGSIKESLGLEKNRPVVGCLASIRPIKGHKYLIEAFSKVITEFPDAYLLLVGWYKEDLAYFQEVKQLVHDLSLDDHVVFTGGRNDTSEMLSVMDVVAFSSINEGFSNAVMEAMAMAKPVVATNAGGTPEAVVNQQTGILIPVRKPDNLAKAISSIIGDCDKQKEFGLRAKERVETIFSIEGMIRKVEDIYEELITIKEQYRIAREVVEYWKLSVQLVRLMLNVIFYYAGIWKLMERSILKKEGIRILAYHRINDNSIDPLHMNIRIEDFERQVIFLRKHYDIITLSEAVNILKDKGLRKKGTRNKIVITFDDGYRDNYLNAYPVLKKYNIPAIIFLTADSLVENKKLWFDVVRVAVMGYKRELLNLDSVNLGQYKLTNIKNRFNAIRRIIQSLKLLHKKEIDNLVARIVTIKEAPNHSMFFDSEMLKVGDISDMYKNGIQFGSHGKTHTILTALNKDEIENEVRSLRKIAINEDTIISDFFAYPNGGALDFNPSIMKMVQKSGYSCAVSLVRGINYRDDNLYSLKRINVNPMNFYNNFMRYFLIASFAMLII